MVSSILRTFPEEFTEHLDHGRCLRPRRLPIPKLLDLTDGHAVYDDSFWLSSPTGPTHPTPIRSVSRDAVRPHQRPATMSELKVQVWALGDPTRRRRCHVEP